MISTLTSGNYRTPLALKKNRDLLKSQKRECAVVNTLHLPQVAHTRVQKATLTSCKITAASNLLPDRRL
jgi:hypothetical protein